MISEKKGDPAMAETTEAIERFEKMAEADPTNELGHFSLGRAYLEAGRYQEAAASFERVLELNANMGKVYQLLATALLKLDRKPEAIEQLTAGVKIAQDRGEILPKNEMVRMLKELGAAVPEDTSGPRQQPVGEGQVLCKRCGRVGPKLAEPPMRGAFGKQIHENICASCWREGIGMGTKIINELRLPLDDPQAGKLWDKHMREFLNLPEA
jgi:tetratricopeptide (TPR) repeat protein